MIGKQTAPRENARASSEAPRSGGNVDISIFSRPLLSASFRALFFTRDIVTLSDEELARRLTLTFFNIQIIRFKYGFRDGRSTKRRVLTGYDVYFTCQASRQQKCLRLTRRFNCPYIKIDTTMAVVKRIF